MSSLKWQRFFGAGLTVLALFIGSVGLTACQGEGEGTGQPEEVEEQQNPDQPAGGAEETPNESEGGEQSQ